MYYVKRIYHNEYKKRFYSLNVIDIKEIVCFPQNKYSSEKLHNMT